MSRYHDDGPSRRRPPRRRRTPAFLREEDPPLRLQRRPTRVSRYSYSPEAVLPPPYDSAEEPRSPSPRVVFGRDREPSVVYAEYDSPVGRERRARSPRRAAAEADDNYYYDSDRARPREYSLTRRRETERIGRDGDFYDNADEYFSARVYEYSPSTRDARSPSPSPSGHLSLPESEDTLPSKETDAATSRGVTVHRVFQSEYTGDAMPGRDHSATLKGLFDPKRKQQPLFRWIHVRQDEMNLHDLTAEVRRISGLREAQKNGLVRLLAKVKTMKLFSTASGEVNATEADVITMPIVLDDDPASTPSNTSTATWICLPYFFLAQYSGLSATSSGAFPKFTLLQMQAPRVAKPRDMEQAIRQLNNTPPEYCFHVAQLWCLVLDDSLLVTCGNMTETVLRGRYVSLEDQLAPQAHDSSSGHSIFISYTGAVTWSIPLNECETWFAFIAHFGEFWPQTVSFTYQNAPVNEGKWDKILALARKSSFNIVLSINIGTTPQPPERGILKSSTPDQEDGRNATAQGLAPPTEPVAGGASPRPIPAKANKRFHVFTWMKTVAAIPDADIAIDTEALQSQLKDMYTYFYQHMRWADRDLYRQSEKSTRQAAFAYLEEQGSIVENTKNRPIRRRQYEDRIDLINAANIIFRFFLPLHAVGATVDKFWGVIERLVEMPSRRGDADEDQRGAQQKRVTHSNVPYVRSALRQLSRPIKSFNEILCRAERSDRAKIKVPDSLVNAWLYLLMGLIYTNQEGDEWRRHLEDVRRLMMSGMAEIIQGFSDHTLSSRTVIQPIDLVHLFGLRLLDDVTEYSNIYQTYSEYLNVLEIDADAAPSIAPQPSDRTFEAKITAMRKEIGIVQSTVDNQHSVFRQLCAKTSSKPAMIEEDYLRTTRHPSHRNRDNEATYYTRATQESSRRVQPSRSRQRPPTYDDEALRGEAPLMLVSGRSGDAAAAAAADTITTTNNKDNSLPAADPGGFRTLLQADCAMQARVQRMKLEGLWVQAGALAEETQMRNEMTRDRQEFAIYAFTLVTAVFLPLSTVSSIFGMNTSDVRDMGQAQWLYWAVAVPVTLLTFAAALWWMGELGNLLRAVGLGGGERGIFGKRGGVTAAAAAMAWSRSRSRAKTRTRSRRRRSRSDDSSSDAGYRSYSPEVVEYSADRRSGLRSPPRERSWRR